jgi:hypothetical protein
MKDSKFFIRVSDTNGIDTYYAERYRSIFNLYKINNLTCSLSCRPSLRDEWFWTSSYHDVQQCFIRLKILRTL